MRFSFILLISLVATVMAAEDIAVIQARLAVAIDDNPLAEAKVKSFVKERLIPLTTDAALVAEAKAQNAKKTSLADIQKIDKEWTEAETELPIQRAGLTTAAAERIRAIANDLNPVRETFAMDNQGANIGQNALTSDYWQGDEEKWTKSFASGNGGVDVGKAKMDKSAGIVLQQVSLPLIDTDGAVVGAITFGLAVDSL